MIEDYKAKIERALELELGAAWAIGCAGGDIGLEEKNAWLYRHIEGSKKRIIELISGAQEKGGAG